MRTINNVSKLTCLVTCIMTSGCYAVNFEDNENLSCQLTTGLSNQDEMQSGPGSLYIMGNCFMFLLKTRSHCDDNAFFVSLPSPSRMGSITIRVSNGNSKNGYHGDQLECSHCDSNDTQIYL